MKDLKRPLTAIAASAVLALAGGGTAWACGGDNSGTYPGDYPGSTDTTTTTDASSTDGTSTTSATTSRAARKARQARLRARHHRTRS